MRTMVTCKFFELTGNPDCRFHRVVDVTPMIGWTRHLTYVAFLRPKQVRRRVKSGRRIYGKHG